MNGQRTYFSISVPAFHIVHMTMRKAYLLGKYSKVDGSTEKNLARNVEVDQHGLEITKKAVVCYIFYHAVRKEAFAS